VDPERTRAGLSNSATAAETSVFRTHPAEHKEKGPGEVSNASPGPNGYLRRLTGAFSCRLAPLPGWERRSHWAPEEFRELVSPGSSQRTEAEVVLGLPPEQPSDDGAQQLPW
jgi:hypothetical protein